MKPSSLAWWLVIGFSFSLTPHQCFGDEPATANEKTFHGKIVFFDNTTDASRLVETMNPDGTGFHTVLELNRKDYRIFGGRISPDGRFTAFTVLQPETKKSAIWLLSADGKHEPLIDDVGDFAQVTSWSPDGKRLTFFHGEQEKWENLVVNVEKRSVEKLPLPASDVVGDWAPDGRALTAIEGNVDKSYNFDDGENYPLRSIYLIKPDGARSASLTRDADGDFIWARFSPDSHKVAYYHRSYKDHKDFKDGHAYEFCAIADPDGSNSRDLVCFTRLLKVVEGAQGIRPNGGPVWSPDGKSIVWIVTKQLNPSDDDTFELIFVAADGSGVRRMPLGKERSWRGHIDCR